MGIPLIQLACDGCGLPALPEHIAERVHRLELATQFRPVHMGILFIALAPLPGVENDFYASPKDKTFFEPFLEALEIPSSTEKSAREEDNHGKDLARLTEFQRRGFFLACLSECPLPDNKETVEQIIQRLGPTLVRRIKFNYRPKQIAPLGQELSPLVEMLKEHGLGPVLMGDDGQALPLPCTGVQGWMQLFRRSVTAEAT